MPEPAIEWKTENVFTKIFTDRTNANIFSALHMKN